MAVARRGPGRALSSSSTALINGADRLRTPGIDSYDGTGDRQYNDELR
jgi:hypothetical protein